MALWKVSITVMKNTATDSEWLGWIEVQKTATRIWLQGEASAAITELDRFIASDPPIDLKRDAVAFRGCIYDDQGDLAAAKADYLSAHAISEKYDFERYTIEISLASIYSKSGDSEKTEKWYLKALQSAAADPTTSGAGALLKLLRIRGNRGLVAEEISLVKKVVYQAWHLLRVDGEPDLDDLEATAKKLLDAHKGPFSAERPPAPKAYTEPTPGSNRDVASGNRSSAASGKSSRNGE